MAAALCGVALCAAGARAEEPAAEWNLPSSKESLVRSMTDVAARFGPDAVLLQGFLLNEALRSGSVLETSVSAPAIESREGVGYLAVTLDSGVVFNDRDLGQEARVARVWSDIVEPALRRYTALQLRADGIGIRVNYHHQRYVDELELRSRIHQGRGEPEAFAAYMLAAHVVDLIEHRLSGQQLLERSQVTLDGRPYVLRLPPASAASAGIEVP